MKKVILVLLLGLFSGATYSLKAQSTHKSQQVIHHVFFYLKNPQSMEDKQKLKEGLKTLETINEVKQLIIGEPASTLKRDVVVSDWDVSEIIYFESIATQDSYQTNPTHQLFVENYSHLWEKVVVYDTLVD